MPLVTDLDLPAFDYTDAELHGPRFHAEMRELLAQGWLAATPLGFAVLEREAASFFLRSRSAEFPGMKIAEIFGIDGRPAATRRCAATSCTSAAATMRACGGS